MFDYLAVTIFACYSMHFGQATRFLPMIVWDHLNPILSLEWNWHKVTEVDKYDHLDFVCPTYIVSVNLLDGFTRPVGEMNENLFRRKWLRTQADLDHCISNGSLDSFCDPNNSGTDRLYQCKNGRAGTKFGVTFMHNGRRDRHYQNDALYIFFNNGEGGRSATLKSTKKKCSMVFAVKVRKTAGAINHDMSYGKCLNPSAMSSNQTNSCVCENSVNNGSRNGKIKKRHVLTSPENLQNDSTIVKCDTGSCSINNVLIVVVIILTVFSTAFLLVILFLVFSTRRSSKGLHPGAHYLTDKHVVSLEPLHSQPKNLAASI